MVAERSFPTDRRAAIGKPQSHQQGLLALSNSLGPVAIGVGLPLTLTIQNNGVSPLVLSGTTVDGVNGSNFVVTTPPASSVAPGASTTLTVTFTPTAAFGSSAALHISSNDPLTGVFTVNLAGSSPGVLTAAYNSASTVPLTASSFNSEGSTVAFSLNFAPPTGGSLTVINNTGTDFIQGAFSSNLAQGQLVALPFNGNTYTFVANYYGGTGNDLVLQWATCRPVSWGAGAFGLLGNNTNASSSVPVSITTTGVLSGKTILSYSEGLQHSLALCSDGTVAAWGNNVDGVFGNNSTTSSPVPVVVSTTGTALAGKTVIAVAAGSFHSLALCSDGTVAAWGNNNLGELGTNNTNPSLVPVAVSTPRGLSWGKRW